MRGLYDRNGRLDKPDIPARRFLNCLLILCAHIEVRRQCTLDLSVVGTTRFKLGFLQSRRIYKFERAWKYVGQGYLQPSTI
jgi:hypothetical protein